MDTENLRYHPQSPYFGKTGYLGCLSETQNAMLMSVEKWFTEEGFDITDLCLNALSLHLVLLRYLRANKWYAKHAMKHISRNIKWRADNNVKELVKMNPSEIVGFDIQKIMVISPHWQTGFDKLGRPIVVKHYCEQFDATQCKNMSSLEALARYHIWEMEAAMRLCYEESCRSGYIVETISAIVNVDGLRVWNLSFDFLSMFKSLADIDQNQYPETLGHTIVINTSFIFPTVWAMVKPFIDPVSAQKIHVLSDAGEQVTWLDNLLGLDNVSRTHGGKMAALDTCSHPYATILDGSEDKTMGGDEASTLPDNGREGSIQWRMFNNKGIPLAPAQELDIPTTIFNKTTCPVAAPNIVPPK